MISAISHGRSFLKLLKYVFEKELSALVSSNTALSPDDGLKRLSGEFLAVCGKRKTVTKNVVHISYSPNNLDDKTDAECIEYIERHLEEMGYSNCPHVIGAHNDTGHRHYHVITSSVDYDGEKVSDKMEKHRNMRISRQLEKELDFVVTEYDPDNKTTPKWQRDKVIVPMDYIKNSIARIESLEPTFPEFIQGIQDLGIDVNATFAGNNIRLSYKYDDVAIKASDCGGSQKLLKQRGMIYEPEQRHQIEQILEASTLNDNITDIRNEVPDNPNSQEPGVLETPDQSGTGQRLEHSDSDHQIRVKAGSDNGAEAENGSGIKDRFKLAKDELRLGYSEAVSVLGEEAIRLNESSASKVKTAIQTVAATVEVIRKHNEQRTDLARMYQVIKGIRTTITDLGNNIKKRTRDLLASRQNKRQEDLNTQRDHDLENLYDRLPEFTKSKVSKISASKKMSNLDYLESNRPEFERIAEKNQSRKLQIRAELDNIIKPGVRKPSTME